MVRLDSPKIVPVHVLEEASSLGHSPLPAAPRVWLPVHVRLNVMEGVIELELAKVLNVLLGPPLYAPHLRVVGPVAVEAVRAPHGGVLAEGRESRRGEQKRERGGEMEE